MGYAYKNYANLENSDIKKDIVRAQTAFEKLGIKDVHLLRPPTGQFNKDVLKIANQYDYTVVHYSINSHDWTNPGVQKVIDNVSSQLAGGDIVLLHASDSAKQTEEALPEIINRLKEKGLKMSPSGISLQIPKLNLQKSNELFLRKLRQHQQLKSITAH